MLTTIFLREPESPPDAAYPNLRCSYPGPAPNLMGPGANVATATQGVIRVDR